MFLVQSFLNVYVETWQCKLVKNVTNSVFKFIVIKYVKKYYMECITFYSLGFVPVETMHTHVGEWNNFELMVFANIGLIDLNIWRKQVLYVPKPY